MIWESSYWKKDLIKDADILRRWSKKNRTTRLDVLLEKKIFIAAYSILKLIDAEKIGPDFPKWNISLESSINNGKKVDLRNWHRIDELYKLESRKKIRLNLKKICDQIKHSFVFGLKEDIFDNKTFISEIYFVSDWEKNKHLYFMRLSDFWKLMVWIGSSGSSGSWEERWTSDKSDKGFKIQRQYGFDEEILRWFDIEPLIHMQRKCN